MTQEQRLLRLLQMNPNKFISAWDIANKCHILHYTDVLMRLRKKGYIIENKTQDIRKNWEYIKYSWYKLITDEKPSLKDKILFVIWL